MGDSALLHTDFPALERTPELTLTNVLIPPSQWS
jgi:hypothetical protein